MIHAVGFDFSYQRAAFKTNVDPEGIPPWALEGLLTRAMDHVRGKSHGRWVIVNKQEHFLFSEGATLELMVFVPAGSDQHEQMLAAVDMFETEITKVSSIHPIDPTLRTLEVNGPKCQACNNAAVWVRSTQFAGDHLFCKLHAEAEEDFGDSHPSYFFWKELEPITT